MTDRKILLLFNLIIVMVCSLLSGLSILYLYTSSFIRTAWVISGLSFLIIIIGTMIVKPASRNDLARTVRRVLDEN